MLSELLVIVLLVLANGVFAGAEIALLSVRKSRIKELCDAGSRRALAVRQLRDIPEKLLATVQIGISVVSAAAAAFGGARVADHLVPFLAELGFGRAADEVAFGLVVALVAILSLVLGELVPKSLALRYAERYALLVARPLLGLAWVMRPLVWFLTGSSNLFLRLFGDKTSFTESRVSSEELQHMVEEAAKSGSLDPVAGEIASRAFDFGGLTVDDVMVPRHKIVAVPKTAPAAELKRLLLEEGHGRMPVYDGTIDNVVGYVLAKDILALAWEGPLIVLQDILRPVLFVPESVRAIDLLRRLQKNRSQLSIVVDEQGTVAGLVTIEDLVEELVGEIFDEHEKPVEEVKHEPDGTSLVLGATQVRDVNRALDIELPEGESFSTIAGLCIELAGWIPKPGTRLTTKDGIVLEVVEASPRRVRSVRVHPTRSPDEPAEDAPPVEG
jgi:putative hemolysin